MAASMLSCKNCCFCSAAATCTLSADAGQWLNCMLLLNGWFDYLLHTYQSCICCVLSCGPA